MKKLQNCLYINRDGAYVHKQREMIVIEQKTEGKKEKLLQVPIHSIGHIFCFGNVMPSPQLMGFCGESGTGLAFFSQYGKFQSRMQGKQTGNVLLRRAQFRISDEQSLSIAKYIIAAKLRSSRSVLQRHTRNHETNDALKHAILRLKQLIAICETANTHADLLGVEGEAASLYFGVLSHLITQNAKGFEFEKRTRRPPKDPVNAMLSLLYSVLGNEVSSALQGVGLDPQVGFLHQDRPGRDSLAQDILEEFRAIIVDRLVLSLVNRRQVNIKDFTQTTLGGVSMTEEGRKKLFAAYQQKKQEEITHPFLKEKVELGLLPHIQAMLLARFIRGDLDNYPPYFTSQ